MAQRRIPTRHRRPPTPEIIAAKIVENLEATPKQFKAAQVELAKKRRPHNPPRRRKPPILRRTTAAKPNQKQPQT